MRSTLYISINAEQAAMFLDALYKNLEQPDEKLILEWFVDREGNFHTRINYAMSPLSVFTDRDGVSFSRLEILLKTQPLEVENADILCATITREELGEQASVADRLVKRLYERIKPGHKDLTRMLQKFILENP